MDYRPVAARLLARLRKETNGAVTGDMESRGLIYSRNYGVSQHAIRNAAAQFAPDHGFAKYLWLQPVRELLLAAPCIADPEQVTAEELGFWFGGAFNTELAENLASFLLARTHITETIITLYGRSGNMTERYAALLAAARSRDISRVPSGKLIQCCEAAAEDGSPQLLRAAGLLLSKAAAEHDRELSEYIDSLSSSADENRRAIFNEIMI